MFVVPTLCLRYGRLGGDSRVFELLTGYTRDTMNSWSRFPLVYEVNTRAWLNDLSAARGEAVTLANVPEDELLVWSRRHFDAVWLMGVWQPSQYSRQLALTDPEITATFGRANANWHPADIASSPYAVAGYRVADELGGEAALSELRRRLHAHSIKLLLDFVPNHTAVEHPWVTTHPEYYIEIAAPFDGSVHHGVWAAAPQSRHLACGRLLDYPPWNDTVQLNLAEPLLRRALIDTVHDIATQCDGVRCDTAITALSEVFHATWGTLTPRNETEFWETAIREIKVAFPDFLFVAEVYGEFEWQLQQLGFDFTYDNTLYERLARADAAGTREHLSADWEFTRRLARFTENHDWTRAAARFGLNNRAAALLSFAAPGLRMVHDGQIEGRRKQSPVYVVRRPDEPVDGELLAFFEQLFSNINETAIVEGHSRVLDLSSRTVVGIERFHPESRSVLCLVNLAAIDSEIAFATSAFAGIHDYHDLRIVSTDLQRTPQLDLWSGGLTVRLRGHEGLLLFSAA
jgi:hypothetical protein